MNQRRNQRQRVLDRLLTAHGAEVPSFELSRISLQYGASVKELREAGFRILGSGQLKPVTPSGQVASAGQEQRPLFAEGISR